MNPPFPSEFPLAVAEAFSVREKVVIVTGAAGWIGARIAEAFAVNGAKVVLSDVPGPALEDASQTLAARAPAGAAAIHAVPADLSKPEDLKTLIAATLARFGRLDALINCGGIAWSGPLGRETEADFDRLYHANVQSIWLLAQYATEPLAASQGCIVNIASVNGHRACFPASLYAGTKAAVLMLTRALAAELAPRRIRINAVSPGPIANVPKHLQWTGRELTEPYRQAFLEHFGQSMSGVGVQSQPLPVGGRPEDVAMAVLYLCTSAARYITGADLLVDGGFLADFYHHDRGENEQGKRLRAYLRELPAEAWKSQRPEWVNRP